MAKLRQYLVAAIAALLLVGAIACDEAPKEGAGQSEGSVSSDEGSYNPASVEAPEPAIEMFGKPVEPNQSAGSDQDAPKQDQLEPPQEPQAQNNRRSMSPTLSEPANAPLSTDTEAEGDPAANTPSSGSNSEEVPTSSQEQSTGSSVAPSQQEPSAGSGARGLGLGQLISGMSNIMNQQQHQQHNGQFYQSPAPFEATRLQPQQQQVQLLQQPQQQQEQVQQVQQQQQQEQQVQQQAQQTSQVPPENLPTIIENDRVNQQSTQLSAQQQQQQQQQAQQPPPPPAQQQQQQQAQQQSQPQQPGGGNALLLPTNVPSGNQTSGNGLAPSTGRTFGEGWTHCQGSSSGKYGTCKNDVNCKKDKGVPDGSCMSGLGVCCVMALSCGDKSHENNTFFANPDFPDPSWEARLCEVEIKKKHSKILQVMIEFEEFELAPPNHEGECITDVFQVGLGSKRPSPYSLLRICGQNTGQHLYLDVSQIDEPLVLSVATSGGGFPRRWSIRIVQMDEKNHLLAPPGCLQYYTDTIGHFRSFNLGRNLKDLYYAVCFRIDNGYSGIRFTSNFFGMNGPTCPRKKMHPSLPFHQYGGHYNQSFEAHPHHLVIPPPGYAMPPPRPYMPITQRPHQFQQQYGGMHGPTQGPYGSGQQRQKRDMPQVIGPMQPAPPTQAAAAGARTFDMSWTGFGGKEHKKEDKYAYKEEKKHPHEYEHSYHQQQSSYAPSYPPTYGPSYGPQQQYQHQHQQQHGYGYGSAPPQYYGQQPKEYGGGGGHPQHYPQQPPMYGPPGHYEVYEHHGKKDDKYAYKDDKKEDKWGWKSDKKDDKWAWGMDKWGWKADKKDEKMEYKDEKYGYKSDKKDDKWWWKQEKKDDKYHHESYPSYHQHQSHSTYGPSGYYGPPPPPNYYGGGEYHHKEIDKFGKKYEHLEHKHEKNHMDKEGKKDEKSWWFWQKKEDKKDKKEKYFTHHEALFPMMHIPEMPHCEPRFCGANDVITFPPSGDSISEMCGNRFNRGRGPKIISGSPLVVYVSNRGHQRGAGFDMNYEQVFYVPKPY